jgi:hypothetical protein
MKPVITETNFTMLKGFDHAFLLFGADDRWLAVIETDPPNHISNCFRPDVPVSSAEMRGILDWMEYTMAFIRFYAMDQTE